MVVASSERYGASERGRASASERQRERERERDRFIEKEINTRRPMASRVSRVSRAPLLAFAFGVQGVGFTV